MKWKLNSQGPVGQVDRRGIATQREGWNKLTGNKEQIGKIGRPLVLQTIFSGKNLTAAILIFFDGVVVHQVREVVFHHPDDHRIVQKSSKILLHNKLFGSVTDWMLVYCGMAIISEAQPQGK